MFFIRRNVVHVYIYIYTYIRAVIIIIIARSTGRIDNRTIVRPVVPFSTTTQSTQNSSLSPPHDSAWLDGLNSPLIQDEGDSKCLKLRFDVSQYTPEEIVVKTVDNKLLVSTFSFFPLLGIFLLLLVLKLKSVKSKSFEELTLGILYALAWMISQIVYTEGWIRLSNHWESKFNWRLNVKSFRGGEFESRVVPLINGTRRSC